MALQGIVLGYQKDRTHLEEKIDFYKRENSRMKHELSNLRYPGRKDFNPKQAEMDELDREMEIVKSLKSQLAIRTQERDAALELWRKTQESASREKEQNTSFRNSKIESLSREMNDMKRDYSDAIALLENKLEKKESDFTTVRMENEQFKAEIQSYKIQMERLQRELTKEEEVVGRARRDKEELSEALRRCLASVEEARGLEAEARTRLADTLTLAQQALDKHSLAQQQNQHLGRELEILKRHSVVVQTREKLEETYKENIRLQKILQSLNQEKEEQEIEFERLRKECYLKLTEMLSKNKTLDSKLKGLLEKYKNDRAKWTHEKKLFKLQVNTLKTNVEATLKEQQYQISCKKCQDMKKKMSKYKKIIQRFRGAILDVKSKSKRKDLERRAR